MYSLATLATHKTFSSSGDCSGLDRLKNKSRFPVVETSIQH